MVPYAEGVLLYVVAILFVPFFFAATIIGTAAIMRRYQRRNDGLL